MPVKVALFSAGKVLLGVEMGSTVVIHSHGVCQDPLPGTDPTLTQMTFSGAPIGFTPHLATVLRCSYMDKTNSANRFPGCFFWSLASGQQTAWNDSLSLTIPTRNVANARIGNTVIKKSGTLQVQTELQYFPALFLWWHRQLGRQQRWSLRWHHLHLFVLER